MKGGVLGLKLMDCDWERCYRFSIRLTCAYDKVLATSGALMWYPWVGHDYDDFRMMVICESHYFWKENIKDVNAELPRYMDDRQSTREIVASIFIECEDGRVPRTFENVQRVLMGGDVWTESDAVARERLWKRLAFMNVIQRPMKVVPGVIYERPTWEDFKEGADAVIDAIKAIKPQLCFVGTTESVGYIMASAKEKGLVVENDVCKYVGRYKAWSFHLKGDNVDAEVRSTKQPGKFYSWSRWREHVFNGYEDIQKRLILP